MDPGSSDCQPRCGWRECAGVEEAPPERSLLLPEVLLELSLLVACDGASRVSPSASPLLLLMSREPALSEAACWALS